MQQPQTGGQGCWPAPSEVPPSGGGGAAAMPCPALRLPGARCRSLNSAAVSSPVAGEIRGSGVGRAGEIKKMGATRPSRSGQVGPAGV